MKEGGAAAAPRGTRRRRPRYVNNAMMIAITMTATTSVVASRSGSGLLPPLFRLILMCGVPRGTFADTRGSRGHPSLSQDGPCARPRAG